MLNYFILLFLFVFIPGCLIDNQDHSLCQPDSSDFESINIHFFGKSTSVYYERKGDQIFTEDDIHLGHQYELQSGVIRVGNPWEDNIFYFKIHPLLPDKKRIYSAIDHWKKKAGDTLTFIEVNENNSSENFVEFVEATGCWSKVGMVGGRQEIGLEKNCQSHQVIHEIGHALGLWHEQSRHDRDEFIEVKWCNIPEDKKHNFLKVEESSRDFGAYDYNSIMHYSRYAFTLNKFPTLNSKTSKDVPFFHPKELSKNDISSIKCFYGNLDYCN